MTRGIVACGEGVDNDAFAFLRHAMEKALSSAAARAALSSCEDFMAFEKAFGRRCGPVRPRAGTALCAAWSRKTCAALSEGRLDDVLAALRKHAGNDEARRGAGYVETNRARMRCPAFRAAGLLADSGVVESSCGAVAGRLKRGGMRWSVEDGAKPHPDAALLVAGRTIRRVLQRSLKTANHRRRLSEQANKYVVHPRAPSSRTPKSTPPVGGEWRGFGAFLGPLA